MVLRLLIFLRIMWIMEIIKPLAEDMVQVKFLQRSAHDLQLEPEQFDVIYCRWVLSWVNEVPSIIAEISKLLKPGGVFLVQEYAQWGTFRIIPEIPAVRTMIEACRESWRIMPSEIDIAPQLPECSRNLDYLLNTNPCWRRWLHRLSWFGNGLVPFCIFIPRTDRNEFVDPRPASSFY